MNKLSIGRIVISKYRVVVVFRKKLQNRMTWIGVFTKQRTKVNLFDFILPKITRNPLHTWKALKTFKNKSLEK
jgi:hypothetical protein